MSERRHYELAAGHDAMPFLAAMTAINLAKQCATNVTVLSVATNECMRDDAE